MKGRYDNRNLTNKVLLKTQNKIKGRYDNRNLTNKVLLTSKVLFQKQHER